MNEKMVRLGQNRSEIRELFEYGKLLQEKGMDVCDLTLGNPTAKTPDWVTEILANGLNEKDIHAYTSAQGSFKARSVIADSLSKNGVNFSADNVVLTCGAAASLCGVFKTLVNSENDEIIALSPYFPEYKVFVEGCGARFKTVGFLGDGFTPDISALDKAITKNTRAIIINSPNNPSGKVYSKEEILDIANLLTQKSIEFNNPIYLVSDEPYREIVFSNILLPFIPKLYKNTIICYSYSKSLSLAGERIGYIAIPTQIDRLNDLYAGFLGSLRSYGYVCAPSLFQYMIENFREEYADFSLYKNNTALLLEGLDKLGFVCNQPKGAFYLLVKAPNGNSKEFATRAKELGLLIVPADSFGASGWLRIATCVTKQTAENALILFEKLSRK